MSGGGVRAFPKNPEKSPRKLKVQEGIEWPGRLTLFLVATDRCSDQCPEVEAVRIWHQRGNLLGGE
jgi:hypothetical protein